MQSSMNQSTWAFMMFMKLDMLKIDVKNMTPRYGWIIGWFGGTISCWLFTLYLQLATTWLSSMICKPSKLFQVPNASTHSTQLFGIFHSWEPRFSVRDRRINMIGCIKWYTLTTDKSLWNISSYSTSSFTSHCFTFLRFWFLCIGFPDNLPSKPPEFNHPFTIPWPTSPGDFLIWGYSTPVVTMAFNTQSWTSMTQWIGLRKHLNRKPWFLPSNLPSNRRVSSKFFPSSNSMKWSIHWLWELWFTRILVMYSRWLRILDPLWLRTRPSRPAWGMAQRLFGLSGLHLFTDLRAFGSMSVTSPSFHRVYFMWVTNRDWGSIYIYNHHHIYIIIIYIYIYIYVIEL